MTMITSIIPRKGDWHHLHHLVYVSRSHIHRLITWNRNSCKKRKRKKSGNKITYLNARNTYRIVYIYIYIFKHAYIYTYIYIYIYIYMLFFMSSVFFIYMLTQSFWTGTKPSGGNTSSNPHVSAPVPRPVVSGMERMCRRYGSDQTPTLLFESKNHVSIHSYSIIYAAEEFLLSIIPNSVIVWSLQ